MKLKPLLIIFAYSLALLTYSLLYAEQKPLTPPTREQILQKVKLDLLLKDSFQVIEYITSLGDEIEVAKNFNNLILDLYWKDKSLPYTVVMGRAGLQYILQKSTELEKKDPKKAKQLKVYAKKLAYNISSFTWPGWDEPGVVVKKDYIVVGLDAAKLNLRLTTLLNSGVLKTSIAYWMLGAQQLANEDYTKALKSFSVSKELADKAKSREQQLLTLGFMGICRLLEGSDKNNGEQMYKDTIKELESINTKNANAFVQQLITARKVFENRNRP